MALGLHEALHTRDATEMGHCLQAVTVIAQRCVTECVYGFVDVCEVPLGYTLLQGQVSFELILRERFPSSTLKVRQSGLTELKLPYERTSISCGVAC